MILNMPLRIKSLYYFQPKYDVQTEHIAGAEALVRWQKPDGTLISPGLFIPLFESDGLVVQLDEYVFETVCRFQKDRMKQVYRFFLFLSIYLVQVFTLVMWYKDMSIS